METDLIFPYTWHIDENERDVTIIRVYGLNRENKNIMLTILNFRPYIYIELPTIIEWTASKAKLVGDKIDDVLKNLNNNKNIQTTKEFQYKKKLYDAHLLSNGDIKMFPYLCISFSHQKYIKQLQYKLNNEMIIIGIGKIKLKIHEQDASPILQFICRSNISPASWFYFKGTKIEKENKITLCDVEYDVKWNHVKPYDYVKVANPLNMAFDIEVNSTNSFKMPNANIPGDKIFQISCVFNRQGSSVLTKYLLTLGKPLESLLDDIKIRSFESEMDLLDGFTELIQETNPNIISGYNIFNFDIPYMINRANTHICTTFRKLGFLKNKDAVEKTIKWSSSAYGNQTFQYLDGEGRLFVDLLPLIKRDYKMDNYKLKTISSFFLKVTKDDLSPQGIFKCYRLGMKKKNDVYTEKAQRALAICGKYCVKDSELVNLLFNKLQIWIGLCEMSKTCNVPIFYLYTQGQQIKVYSQLYKHCMYNNYVVEKDGYVTNENDHYTGASVIEPKPGVYDKVLPFDFASLYPSTIIAYNIDYSTFVNPLNTNLFIYDKKCHIIEWEDHVGCSHDKTIRKTKPKHIICCKQKFKYLKEPKGVMPTVLQNLLDARAHTRSQIKILTKITTNESITQDEKKLVVAFLPTTTEYTNEQLINIKMLIDVLDKRQLAYKVSANSMYGAMGVQKGYLPFMPGAMSTTAMGRKNIEVASSAIINTYKGELVYGDTDSAYIIFPHLTTAAENWQYAIYVSKEVSKLFPKPIYLEFENTIYWRFFILTKKRYMYLKCDENGTVDSKIGKKGVLLARRDNSLYIRTIYEQIIQMVFNKQSRDVIISFILDEIYKLCSHFYDYKSFIITKSVGNNGIPSNGIINDKLITSCIVPSTKKGKLGDYTITLLPNDNEKERIRLLQLKESTNNSDYYLHCLPAVVQLAHCMRKRGQLVDVGSRLEYVITTTGGINAKQYKKIEDATYFSNHSSVLQLDYLYYLKLMTNPFDDVLNILFKSNDNPKPPNIILHLYKSSLLKHKVHDELSELFKPILKYEELK